MDDFNVIDFNAPGASNVRERIESRLDALHNEIVGTQCSDARTHQIRGAINELNALLGAGKAPPVIRAPRYGSMDAFQRAQRRAATGG